MRGQLAIHPADPQPFDRRGPPVYPGLVRYRWAGVDRYTLADLDAFRAAKTDRQSVRTVIPTDVTCCSLYAHPDVVPGRLSRRQTFRQSSQAHRHVRGGDRMFRGIVTAGPHLADSARLNRSVFRPEKCIKQLETLDWLIGMGEPDLNPKGNTLLVHVDRTITSFIAWPSPFRCNRLPLYISHYQN